MVTQIQVWRATGRAKYPLCTLTAFVLSTGERDGWSFRPGNPHRSGYQHMPDDVVEALLQRHRVGGNRIVETQAEAW